MSLEDRLLELVGEAAVVFDWEEFDEDTDIEILEHEDFPVPFVDFEDDASVFRLFVTEAPTDLNTELPDYFARYREFESEYEDAEEATLVWRSASDEDDFWYLRRTDDGDIGLFHSDLSLEEDDGSL